MSQKEMLTLSLMAFTLLMIGSKWKMLLQLLLLIELGSLLVLSLLFSSPGISFGSMFFMYTFMVMEAMILLSSFYLVTRLSGSMKSKMALY